MNTNEKAVIGLTVLSTVSLVLVLIFNALATTANTGLFRSSTGNVSDKYPTDVTPAGYTFSIWAIIYTWQSVWVVYALSTIFRRNSKGRIIFNPVVLPVLFHVFWILSCIFNITWLFLWDQENLIGAFVVLLLITLTGYAATAFQAIATSKHEDEIREESKIELKLIYIFVQNGTDLIFSWTTVATLLNLSIAATYAPNFASGNMSRQSASTLALSLLLVIVIGWSVAENTVFFKFFRFVYAWYGVLIWAGIGILVKNYDISNPNTILTIVIIVVAVLCLIIKMVVYFCRNPCGKGMHDTSKIELSSS